ncbi:MAG: flagellar basal body rod protein FlgC [Verrucomicrobiae bacterium]|nr:flagellar basal body rod protein FlgC [Verrucomicrobiae bacterium]
MSLSLIPGIDSSGSAIDAERMRLNVIANNIANANTTQSSIDAEGKAVPYKRQLVVFESVLAEQTKNLGGTGTGNVPSAQVRVQSIQDDPSPMKSVYMPGHPHADAKTGMVLMPNINVAEEMVDMITASRAIEANVQAITTAKQMVRSILTLSQR